MDNFNYIKGVSTLTLDVETCTGCSKCIDVCPHEVFVVSDRKARITDKDLCMECGACSKNCPVSAIKVVPGTGCASLIIQTWLHERNIKIGSGGGCC